MRDALSLGRELQKKDPKSWEAVAIAGRAQSEMAELLYELGQEQEAIELARVAVENLGQAAQKLKSPSMTLLTLYAPLSLGRMLSETGEVAESMETLNDTIARAEQELAARPQDTNLRFILAKGRFQRAVVDADSDAPPEDWRSSLEAGIGALDQLVREFPKTASFRRNLAEALVAKARVELRHRQSTMAADAADRAIGLLERLDEEEDSPAVFQPLLAAAYSTAGEAELARGNKASAKATFTKAESRFRRARELNPESKRLSDRAAHAQSLLASLEK
jgi:tetratricopeptide (TPR) repeat protein